ncbi:MAG: hypothetical protein ACOYOF_07755 [Verrucomicrobiaceae bacterium]
MSEKPANYRRVIFWALFVLPFGTIALGALSFVFYFNKQEQALQRSIRYAAGLRRDLNEADLKHQEQVMLEALAKAEPDRSKALAAFLESTLGPENMGYTVREVTDRSGLDKPALALEVEATGGKKAQDVVLVLGGWLPGLATLDNSTIAKPMAAFLGLAHSFAGESKVRSLRFVAVQDLKALKAYYLEGVGFRDRIQQLVLLGGAEAMSDADVLAALHLESRGTVLLRPKAGSLAEAEALRKQVSDLAERL